MILPDGVGTVLVASTFFAVFATPYAVKMLYGRFYKMGVVRQDSGLEVAAVGTFHAHSGASKVAEPM